MERPRDRLERVLGVRELPHLGDARSLGGGQQEAVVGADEQPAVAVGDREGAARAADTGVDDGEVDADRHVRQRAREHERALEDRVGGMPCVTSITRASGAIRAITPWHVPTKSSWSPKSVRKQMTTRTSLRRRERAPDGGDEPVEVARRRLGDDREACRARRAVVSGPIDTAGIVCRERARSARAADAEARTTRSHVGPVRRRELHRPVERDHIRAERVREQARAPSRAREEHAARRRRQRREQPFLRRRRRQRRRRRRTRRRSPGRSPRPGGVRRASAGAARARRSTLVSDDPVVASTSTGASPSGSIATSGTWTTSWPRRAGPSSRSRSCPAGRVTTIRATAQRTSRTSSGCPGAVRGACR